ncbi:hypothetical protein F8M41_023323 [Gigaspora margarita]|uniref:Uncharacterized protein n=1 Tax=Gigaspora margarita TaxID=4874 RepID=A0A8H4ADM4_GIGMA|nr:hypothetical protein F8M41_023323 [Gigaspora margarita]
MDIDWDSFITIPDIFNDTDLPSLSDDNDININLYPSSSNHNDYDTIVNTNLLPLEYDQNFSLLSEDDDDFNTSISLPFENKSNVSGSSY